MKVKTVPVNAEIRLQMLQAAWARRWKKVNERMRSMDAAWDFAITKEVSDDNFSNKN